jgi:hypothetical protein
VVSESRRDTDTTAQAGSGVGNYAYKYSDQFDCMCACVCGWVRRVQKDSCGGGGGMERGEWFKGLLLSQVQSLFLQVCRRPDPRSPAAATQCTNRLIGQWRTACDANWCARSSTRNRQLRSNSNCICFRPFTFSDDVMHTAALPPLQHRSALIPGPC